MTGERKVSEGLRAGCRLTLPTCERAEQWAVAALGDTTDGDTPQMTLTCWLSPAHQAWAPVAGSVPAVSGNRSSWKSWVDCGKGDGARWASLTPCSTPSCCQLAPPGPGHPQAPPGTPGTPPGIPVPPAVQKPVGVRHCPALGCLVHPSAQPASGAAPGSQRHPLQHPASRTQHPGSCPQYPGSTTQNPNFNRLKPLQAPGIQDLAPSTHYMEAPGR